jgi:peroxiredoxin
MKLTNGQKALDFTGTDIHGNTIKLSDYKGKKIMLGFFRNVNCPFCNRRVHQLMGMKTMLQNKNVQLVLMFESSTERLTKSVFHEGITPWPIIGDPEKKVYEMYGVEASALKAMRTMISSNMFKAMKDVKDIGLPKEKDTEATATLIPADFLINEDFTIVNAHYGKHLDDHISIDELKKFAGINY